MDLAQDVLLQVWRARERYSPSAPFIVFLLTVTRNVCRNANRSKARSGVRLVTSDSGELPERADSGPVAAEQILRRQEANRVREALIGLPESQREALVLRFDQGFDYRTIAEVLGRNESTVRSQVFHGLRRLRSLVHGETV